MKNILQVIKIFIIIHLISIPVALLFFIFAFIFAPLINPFGFAMSGGYEPMFNDLVISIINIINHPIQFLYSLKFILNWQYNAILALMAIAFVSKNK